MKFTPRKEQTQRECMVWNRHFRPLLNVYVYQLTFVSIVRLIDPQAMASILITFSTVALVALTLTDV